MFNIPLIVSGPVHAVDSIVAKTPKEAGLS